MPRVSIVVPVYNAEKTLERCLDSLARQTLKDFEVLLINDGSRDSSLAICEDYQKRDDRFRVFSQENQGPSTARNAGIDRAAGQYIYFVDADDFIEDDAIARLYEAAASSGADLTICGFYYVKGDSRCQHQYPYDSGIYEEEACRKIALDLVGDHSYTVLPPYCWIRMIRRDLLENPKLRFTDRIIRSEDYLFSTELHFRTRRLCLIGDQALYHYIDTEDSITNTYVKAYWQMARRIYALLRERLPDSRDISYGLYTMLIYRSLIALNNTCRAGERKVFSRDVSEILADRLLMKAVDTLKWRDGFRRFKVYYILMRIRLKSLVRLRYYLKYRQQRM